jgi:hypothetical protein
MKRHEGISGELLLLPTHLARDKKWLNNAATLKPNSSSVVIWLMATWTIVILMEPWCRIRTDHHLATLPLLRIRNNSSRSCLLRCTCRWCAMSIGAAVLVYRPSNGCFFPGRRRDDHLLLNRSEKERTAGFMSKTAANLASYWSKEVSGDHTNLAVDCFLELSIQPDSCTVRKKVDSNVQSAAGTCPNKEPVMPEMSSQAMHEWNIPCAVATRSRRIEAKPTEVLIFACLRL